MTILILRQATDDVAGEVALRQSESSFKAAIVIVDDIVGGLLQADFLCIKKPICGAGPPARARNISLEFTRLNLVERNELAVGR